MQYLVAVLALFAAAQAAPQSPYLIPQESFQPKAIPTLQLSDAPSPAAKAEHLQAHAQALGLAPSAPLINSAPKYLAAPAIVAAPAPAYVQPAVNPIAPAYLNSPALPIAQIQPAVNRIAPAYLNAPSVPITYLHPVVKSSAPLYAYAQSSPKAYQYL